MTNAELIAALQTDIREIEDDPVNTLRLMWRAADALEAADKRIADLETALAACRARKWEQNIKPINPHGELREMLIDGMIDRMGEWLDEQRGRWIYAKCNLCGKVQDVRSNYCPNCGAKMKGENDEQIH